MRMGVIYAVVVQTWMELFGGRADTMEKVWDLFGNNRAKCADGLRHGDPCVESRHVTSSRKWASKNGL